MTVLERYYHEHASKLPTADSRKAARTSIDLFRELCGDATVADFGKREQERVVAAMRERGFARGYIRKHFDTAKAALRRAYGNEEIAAVPPFLKLPKGEPRDRVLSLDEAAALFNAAARDSQFLYLVLAFGTAARPGALLELTRVQCDVANRRIRLNPRGRAQTKKRRPVLPMAETLVPWLEDCKTAHVIQHGGKPYSRQGWKAIFGRLADRAGVPDATPYTIRHTVATELAKRGVPWHEIELFLGHAIASTSAHYVHYAPEYLAKAIAAVDAYFGDLSRLVSRPLLRRELDEQPLPDDGLRAQCVPIVRTVRGNLARNVLSELVGMTGFEPATPTSRT